MLSNGASLGWNSLSQQKPSHAAKNIGVAASDKPRSVRLACEKFDPPRPAPHQSLWESKKDHGVLDMNRTNADEDGTRTRATFVTRKLIAQQMLRRRTLTWRHNQLGHLTYLIK